MNQKYLKFFTAVLFAFTTSCASKPSHTVKHLNLDKVDAGNLKAVNTGPFQFSHLIYTSSKLPLEDFFNGVSTGQFNAAFKNLDLLYHPSNTENELLLQLLNHGFVPVFVSVKNNGAADVPLAIKNFMLIDGQSILSPIAKSEVPSRITRFDASNAMTNAFNAGVIILAMAALLAIIITSGAIPSGGHFPSGGDSGSSEDWYEPKATTIVTKVDYGRLLLEDQILKPNETARGLLLFQTKNKRPPANPKLQLRGQ